MNAASRQDQFGNQVLYCADLITGRDVCTGEAATKVAK